MSEAKKQKAYSNRMKAKGNALVAVWVSKEHVVRLRKYAKRLRAK